MRMHLHTYVCEGGRVRNFHKEGTLEFVDVFNMPPSNCRYAVVQVVGEEFVTVYDLYNATITREWVRVGEEEPDKATIGPGKLETYPTLDAAVMATALRHE